MLVNYEKQSYRANGLVTADRVPLTARPFDLLYFLFFAVHIPATLLLDLQYIYPSSLTPAFLSNMQLYYVKMTNDPLVGTVSGYFGDHSHLLWFKCFLFLEAIFQLPTFFLGMRGLYKGSRSIYVLLLIYGASTATTTYPCVAAILQAPPFNPETVGIGIAYLTSEQRLLLLSSYIPFLLIPLIMTIDMASRLLHLVQVGVKAEEANKWK